MSRKNSVHRGCTLFLLFCYRQYSYYYYAYYYYNQATFRF